MVTKAWEISRRSEFQKIIHAVGNVSFSVPIFTGDAYQVHTSDTKVPKGIIWYVIHNSIQLRTLSRLLRVQFPQSVQPCELKELLRPEEACNEIWMWAEVGYISVVDVFHVWGGEDAILLCCKIDYERCWRL